MLGTRLFWDCGSQSALVSLDGWYTLGQKRECECQCSLKSPFAMNIRRINGIVGTRIRLRVTWGKHGPRLQFFFLPFLPSVRSVLRPFYFAHNIHTKSGKGLQWAPAGGGGGWSAGKGWHLDTNIPHRIPNQVYAFRAGVSLAMACYTTCYTRLTPSGPRVLAYINWHCFFFFLEREFECELKCINITGSHCSNRSI